MLPVLIMNISWTSRSRSGTHEDMQPTERMVPCLTPQPQPLPISRRLAGMSRIMTGIEVRKVFDDGSDVLTWFDLATSLADPVRVANWMRVQDGKITRIRVAFDPRGIANGS